MIFRLGKASTNERESGSYRLTVDRLESESSLPAAAVSTNTVSGAPLAIYTKELRRLSVVPTEFPQTNRVKMAA